MKIVILDYGFGNTGSIKNMLHKIGVNQVIISSEKSVIQSATHLIIPGVGQFDNAMKQLVLLGLDQEILSFADSGRFILGICLGMQILGTSSEEGQEKGLSLIPFKNIRFNASKTFKVPHMGWNVASFSDEHVIGSILNTLDRFYFVHSYHATDVPKKYILSTTTYDLTFVSGVIKDNIIGVQFHPEKSHAFGMKFFKAFLAQTNV
jgi:glutamine amidotransferase